MSRMRSWSLPVAVLFVAAIILLAGGLAVASNMGFKLNKPLCTAGAGQIGNNWTSIPYNNPYVDIAGLCAQTGLPGATTFQRLNADGSFAVAGTCTAPPAGALVAGRGLQIRVPVGGPSSIIIVGSHNPATTVAVPVTGAGPLGNNWYSVPYHATAVTLNDVCVQAGMSGGIAERLDGCTGVFSTKACPSPDAATVNLVLGEHIRLRQPPAGVTFTPAHF